MIRVLQRPPSLPPPVSSLSPRSYRPCGSLVTAMSPPPLSLHYNFSWLGIVPIDINLHCYKAIKSGCGSAEQRGCMTFDMTPAPAQHARHRCSYGTAL